MYPTEFLRSLRKDKNLVYPIFGISDTISPVPCDAVIDVTYLHLVDVHCDNSFPLLSFTNMTVPLTCDNICCNLSNACFIS